MPIYEYRCGACGHRFEALLARMDEAAPGCPQCGASRSEKLLSAFAVTRGGAAAPPGSCGLGDCGGCCRN